MYRWYLLVDVEDSGWRASTNIHWALPTIHQWRICTDPVHGDKQMTKGERTKPSNYRPVSLTSVVFKSSRSLSTLFTLIMRHWFLVDNQHGFRVKHSNPTDIDSQQPKQAIKVVFNRHANVQHNRFEGTIVWERWNFWRSEVNIDCRQIQYITVLFVHLPCPSSNLVYWSLEIDFAWSLHEENSYYHTFWVSLDGNHLKIGERKPDWLWCTWFPTISLESTWKIISNQFPSVEPGNPTATTSSQSMPDSTHTKYSCFPRTIHEWNDLQNTSVMASSADDLEVSLCN